MIRKISPWLLGLFLAAASGVATTGTAQADDAPGAGTWRKLAQRKFRLAAPSQPVDVALQDALRVVRSFRPASAKITDLKVTSPGPKRVPRVSFRSTHRVPISLGIVDVTREETVWVRGDVTVHKLKACPYDDKRLGYEIIVDLTDSDEPVAANVSNWATSLCVHQVADGSLDVQMTTFMQIGPDYGTWMAGRLVTDMLIQQTDPLVAAIKGESR